MAVASFPTACVLFLSEFGTAGRNSDTCSLSTNEPFASRSVVQRQPTDIELESDSCPGARVRSSSWWSCCGSEQTGVQVASGSNWHPCWQLQNRGQGLHGHQAGGTRAWVVLLSQRYSRLARYEAGLRLLFSVLCPLHK